MSLKLSDPSVYEPQIRARLCKCFRAQDLRELFARISIEVSLPLVQFKETIASSGERELIDHKASMITDEDPLRGLLFYEDLGFSHTAYLPFLFNF